MVGSVLFVRSEFHAICIDHIYCLCQLFMVRQFSSADPNIMKKFQVDRGAIKFVFSGANIMCPGLTSSGGILDEEVEGERPVVCP